MLRPKKKPRRLKFENLGHGESKGIVELGVQESFGTKRNRTEKGCRLYGQKKTQSKGKKIFRTVGIKTEKKGGKIVALLKKGFKKENVSTMGKASVMGKWDTELEREERSRERKRRAETALAAVH